MKEHDEKMPNPREIEKEISEFLSKKFGGSVKIVSPIFHPQEVPLENAEVPPKKEQKINFNLIPEDLVSYLDQYIVKQDDAKAILATKICTHFNRIKHANVSLEKINEIVGSIKNNILMIGPTGVGKTYMVKLIANKIGVPFVKGDATKFSETGYVGGDVEDLVRDLVREANDNIELAQHGIIYIDELDKIAANKQITGSDISRTGVQRALLKPMEETDIDLKVPHDPISMIQEIERFRKTGKRDKRSVNTKNILFIMSGAFSDISEIIKKRMKDQGIGFGAKIISAQEEVDILKHVKSEDLIEYGFETEFVGRLPVKAVFDNLTESDLYKILRNPNNPVILGKKLDFATYGIDIKFESKVFRILAKHAFEENTGARGLVSAIEKALLLFEKRLPSTNIKKFPVNISVIEDREVYLKKLLSISNSKEMDEVFEKLELEEKKYVNKYIIENKKNLNDKYNLTLSPSRVDIVASYYCKNIMDIENAIKNIKSYYDDIKKIELYFFKNSDINIVLESNAIDFIIEQLINSGIALDNLYKKFTGEFEDGLKLIRSKTGKNRFFITKDALLDPEHFINKLIKNEQQNSLTI
ncbi:MAG: AAA domain-containing protein [Desulfobacteraceae bacterium]|nr:AAA domain-containing protein [Desulfobacteraceae bacterium]MBC2718858.1 AAA family ATPase [Desulfobacteraceae bacterium]